MRASGRPRDPRVAVTLAAGRVTLQQVATAGSVPVASTVVDERADHRLDVTIDGDTVAISVDGRLALRHTVRWSTSGGIGLGALARPHRQPPAHLLRPRRGPGMTGHAPTTPHRTSGGIAAVTDIAHRTPRRSALARRGAAIAIGMLAMVLLLIASQGRAAAAQTVVSIEFDDGAANQYEVRDVLTAHGMDGDLLRQQRARRRRRTT